MPNMILSGVYHQEYGSERAFFLVLGRSKNGNYKGIWTDGKRKPVCCSINPNIPWIKTPTAEIPSVLREVCELAQ